MDHRDAENLATNLMAEHGLAENGWTFAFDRARKRLGLCNYTRKRITISQHMAAAATRDQVEQTMLHEIAHALLPTHDHYGRVIGHGPQWKRLAAEIGYTGRRTAENPALTPS